MITITRNQATAVRLSLNRNNVDADSNVRLLFHSSSRGELELEKSLTDIGSGFFYISLLGSETALLIDDTYSYYLYQNEVLLKHGFVRLKDGQVEEVGFDYTFDLMVS